MISAKQSKVRVGLVGASWFMDLWHIPALVQHPMVELVAVSSAGGESARQMAEKYGFARAYTSFEEMFRSEQLDAAVIVTPNDQHAPAALAAIEHGIHVSCEKPLAMDADEAWQMHRAATEKNVLNMTNFTYRDHPFLRRMQQLVNEGYIGTYYTGTFTYVGGYGLNGPPGWRGTKSRSGAGILGDLGSHLVDMAHMVLNQSVIAVGGDALSLTEGNAKRYDHPDVGDRSDESAVFAARFSGGGQGVFHTSWLAEQGDAFQTQEIRLFGSEGTLHFTASGYGGTLRGIRHSSRVIEVFEDPGILPLDEGAEPSEDRFRPWRLKSSNSTYRFIDAIVAGQEIRPSFYDGYRAQEVVDSVLRSSSTGTWVDVPYKG